MNDFAASSARRHYDSVYRFVRRRATSKQDAEDLTQEVFEAAVAALGAERLTEEPQLAWLYTVAQRRLIRSWQRRLDTEPFDEDTAQLARRDEYSQPVVESVVAAIQRLPDSQRQVIVQKLFEGRSFGQIARGLNVSEETCRQRLSRGLTRVREELRSKGITP